MVKILAAIGSTVLLALLVGAASAAAAAPGRSPNVQNVGLTILAGDRIAEPNIALAPGVPVRMTVTNFTRQFHTFTAPGLGLSVLILPARGHTAKTTTFSFTPRQGGSFAWHCAICPTDMHGKPHTMGGTIYVIIDPSALP